jgi:hypothetical protein
MAVRVKKAGQAKAREKGTKKLADLSADRVLGGVKGGLSKAGKKK